MGLFSLLHCPQCRSELEDGQNFCSCGAPIRDFRRVCSQCRQVVDVSAQKGGKCGNCGALLEDVKARYVLVNWARRPREFARKIEISDLHGALDGGVTVDMGTRALFLVNGRLEEELGPGWTSATSDTLSAFAGEEYLRKIQVIAVDASDTQLEWEFPATTKDPFQVSVRIGLAMSLSDAVSLANNLLKEKEALSVQAVQEWLQPALASVVKEKVASETAETMQVPDSDWRRDFEDTLRSTLEGDLTAAGLRVERLVEFEIESPRLADLLEAREAVAGSSLETQIEASAETEKLEHIEKLQKALVQKKRLDDKMLLEIKKSGSLNEMALEELERARKDEDLGWRKAREILAVQHTIEMEKLAKAAELELFVDENKIRRAEWISEEEAKLLVEGKQRDLDDRGKNRDLDRDIKREEHEAEIAMRLLDSKQKGKLQQLEALKDQDDPEKILALLSSISADSADALKARYSSAGEEGKADLLKDALHQALDALKGSRDDGRSKKPSKD